MRQVRQSAGYARGVSLRGQMPGALRKRIEALMERGLDPGLAHELWYSRSVALVAKAERADDEQIAEMNAVYTAR